MSFSPTFALDCWVHRVVLGFEGKLDPPHYEWIANHNEACVLSSLTFSWKFWLENSIQVQLRCSCGSIHVINHGLPFQFAGTPERGVLSLDGGWAGQDLESPVSRWQRKYQAELERSPHGRYAFLRRILPAPSHKMWLSPHILGSDSVSLSSQCLSRAFPGRQVMYRPPTASGLLPAVYGPAFVDG